jgi:hypothetical protein
MPCDALFLDRKVLRSEFLQNMHMKNVKQDGIHAVESMRSRTVCFHHQKIRVSIIKIKSSFKTKTRKLATVNLSNHALTWCFGWAF